MDEREMMAVVESVLFVSGDPVSLKDIARILDIDLRVARKLMESMMDCFNFERRGLQVVKANETYQLATRPEHGEYIQKLVSSGQKQGLSQAGLETLSIIAYRQPITRMDIEALRGVKCDYTIALLQERGFIKEVDRLDAPGRPILYGTTELFLRSFGLSSLEDLPPLGDI